MRILLAEDHPDTSEAFSKLLQNAGHKVIVVGTIRDAELFLLAEPFDVVISDLLFPEGEAWDLASIADRRGIPAIAVTALGDNESIKHANSAGFVATMVKPINFVELEKVLYEAVRSYRPKIAS